MHNKIMSIAFCCLFMTAGAFNTFAGGKVKANATSTTNPITYVTSPEKVQMLKSLKDVDGTSRFLEMDYTADYKLEAMLAAQPTSIPTLLDFVNKQLFDKPATFGKGMSFGAGCSCFAATEYPTGDYLMGRNYDEHHINPKTGKDEPITAILVRTAPKNGKKSISMVDTKWLGLNRGFYTDGKTDLSVLMAMPYAMLDGMNEDGLAFGILFLDGTSCVQNAPGKRVIGPTVAMRLILDKCSDVPSAIDTLKRYNMNLDIPGGCNYHFFLADAKGHFSILEYSYRKNANVFKENPNIMKPLTDKDEFRCITNYYCDPDLKYNDYLGGLSQHGKLRHNIMRDKLEMTEYKLTKEEAMQLLGTVAQRPNPDDNTSHTQWSALYNLSKRTLDIAILKDYEHRYVYEIK